MRPEKREDSTHFLYYASAAVISSLATVTAFMALRFVTFPLQVIFKSAKPLAVMLIGLMVSRRYPVQRYFFILVIVIGVIVFKFFEKEKKRQPDEDAETDSHDSSHLYGIALLMFSLFADGVLAAIQDQIVTYSPSFRQMMFHICSWSSVLLSVTIILTGEFFEVIDFIERHSNVLWHLGSLGLADTVGTIFAFVMILSFGALACSVVTTVRKLFSIIFSIIFFGHASTPIQWLGAALVFSGLFGDVFFGKNKSKEITLTDDACSKSDEVKSKANVIIPNKESDNAIDHETIFTII